MAEEITNRSVLLECVRRYDDNLKLVSKGGRMLEPKKGMEDLFEEYQLKGNVIRKLIHALGSEPVRETIDHWERMVKHGGESA